MKVALGSDHAGFEYKEKLRELLGNKYEIKDFGTHSKDSADYPDFAHPVSAAVENKEFALGILVCGSANGVAITANKHQGIRAAICWNEELASLARKHNDANILCIPARFIDFGMTEKIVDKLAARQAAAYLNQARDFFHAAEESDVSAAKPLLLYYSFLNLAKCFVATRQGTALGTIHHGLSEKLPTTAGAIHGHVSVDIAKYPESSAFVLFARALRAS